MAEMTQIFFSHKEVLELLIKKAAVHEGKWVLAANMGFTAGNFGPGPDQIAPGAIVTVLQLGITRAAPDTPEPMTLDAAVVNPAPGEGHPAPGSGPRRPARRAIRVK
jgi:hypothetical protein